MKIVVNCTEVQLAHLEGCEGLREAVLFAELEHDTDYTTAQLQDQRLSSHSEIFRQTQTHSGASISNVLAICPGAEALRPTKRL